MDTHNYGHGFDLNTHIHVYKYMYVHNICFIFCVLPKEYSSRNEKAEGPEL